jgi:hypothetical protein
VTLVDPEVEGTVVAEELAMGVEMGGCVCEKMWIIIIIRWGWGWGWHGAVGREVVSRKEGAYSGSSPRAGIRFSTRL